MSPSNDLLEPTAPEPEPDNPEPDSETQAEYGADNRDLPKQLVDALRAIFQKRQGEEKYSRRREVIRDRKLRFYEVGHQHIQWNNYGNNGGFSVMTPGGLGWGNSGQNVQCPQYIDDYNIFFPYLRILTSVLTQNPPGVLFQPIDPSIVEDIDKSKTAEVYAKAFDRYNDIKSIQKQIVRMMGVSGRTVSWTRTEADAKRFGVNPDGTPKLFQRTTIHGCLESKTAIMAREYDQSLPYVFIYQDFDVNYLKGKYADYPHVEEIKAGQPGLGENQYERTARLGVLSGSRSYSQVGDSLTHMTTQVDGFIRPCDFEDEAYDSPFEGGEGESIRDKLNEMYPDGARVVWVGDTYMASYAECMDDHIDIQFPYEGDGMSRPPFMDMMVVVQDFFNDDMNWAREKFDTGAGSLWINADETEIDAITSQRAAPNAIRARKARNGMKTEDEFFQEPDPNLPATLVEFIKMLQNDLPQFMLAALPSLQGDAESTNKTASGYAQARAQAMGQLGIIWSAIQRMFARIRYQSALAASRCEDLDDMVIPGEKGEQSIEISMAQLRKGNFGCYPDEDSSFPESTQQQRSTFMSIFQMAAQSPQLQVELDNPDNWELAKRMFGLDELVILSAEARDKQLGEIEQLLKQEPVEPTPQEMEQANVAHAAAALAARAQGLPEPPPPDPTAMLKPSIPVDDLDYHQWEGAKGQEWLSSPARRAEDARGNQKGVLNVKLHVMQHLARAAAMAPPPTAAPPHKAVAPAPPKSGPPAAAPAPAASPALI